MWINVLLAALLLGQNDIRVAGIVRDATGLTLAGATVEANGALVAVTDERGEFSVSVPAIGALRVRIALPGFEARELSLDADGRRRPIDVVLSISSVRDAVTVAAVAPAQVAPPRYHLRPIDVYRTAGAQADVFRALQTLAGTVVVDEGAGLFVRGGDVSEVLVTLDDATLAHPYRHETPTGGFRGLVDPLHIAGVSFSTGGFPARYGNALSAVVDLESAPPPRDTEAGVTLGLAGASASVARPFGKRVTVRGTANRTFTRLLFDVNGAPRYFSTAPTGWDVSGGVTLSLGRGGLLRAFALEQRDEVGVEIERDAFVGVLRSKTDHHFGSLHWDGAIAGWRASAALGHDDRGDQTKVGALDIEDTDRHQSWRFDLDRTIGNGWITRAGVTGTHTASTTSGRVPVRGGDFAGVGGDAAFSVDFADWTTGSYMEVSRRVGAVTPSAGVRIDRYDQASAVRVDPRVSVGWQWPHAQQLRVAWGIYHQAADPGYADRIRGTAGLPPMRATHYVLGYEHGAMDADLYIRIEGYAKQYESLPLEKDSGGYSASGYGSAAGLDLFVQQVWTRLQLRASAGWLRARRRWTPIDARDRYPLPDGTWLPDFAIPFSSTVSANLMLTRSASLAATWRLASGRPHTPILGATPIGDRLAPVFGAINAERLPRYERLDLSASLLRPIGTTLAIFFVSLDNVLARQNFSDYVYAADYASRRPIVSAAPRTVYVGVSFRR